MKKINYLLLSVLFFIINSLPSCTKDTSLGQDDLIENLPTPPGLTEPQIAGGGYHSMILKTDNTLWGSGHNFYGQLGDGKEDHKYVPEKIADKVLAVSLGLDHSLFIKSDNSAWAMGNNEFGQLGDGTQTKRPTPVKILKNVKAVTAGFSKSFFIKTDNTLWATGWNAYGALGDGTNETRSTPVKSQIM